jgi:hypothetical protein
VFIVQPAQGSAAIGTVYAWGAQAENAVVPSSYIKTEGSTVTRNADSLYFPASGVLTERTIYARLVEYGTGISGASVVAGYFNGASTPSFRLASTTYGARHDNGSTNVTASTGVTPSRGDLVEARAVLRSSGAAVGAVSVNGGTEVATAASAANAISATPVTRFYIGGPSLASPLALTHVLVAAGEQSLSTMRNLAGVV